MMKNPSRFFVKKNFFRREMASNLPSHKTNRAGQTFIQKRYFVYINFSTHIQHTACNHNCTLLLSSTLIFYNHLPAENLRENLSLQAEADSYMDEIYTHFPTDSESHKEAELFMPLLLLVRLLLVNWTQQNFGKEAPFSKLDDV